MNTRFNTYRTIIAIAILLLAAEWAVAQTTYYSRDGATLPRNWNEADSWTLNSDGSGPAAAVPGRTDHVVILSGHEIIIINDNDNGSAGFAPDDVADPLVGVFAGSGDDCFYQTGDLTIELGGTLTSTPRLMLGGSTFIFGAIDVDGDLINLGDLIMTASSSFSSTDDLIISGSSNTRIDNLSASSYDDLYIDNNVATLCGTGSLAVGVNPNVSEVQYLNGATINQICSGFEVTGCITCTITGTGPLPPGPSLTGTGTTINYIENSVVAVDDAVNVIYSSGPFLTNAVFSVSSGYIEGEDIISFTNTIWITGSYDVSTGTLTLTGYANEANWEIALRSITYENASDNPTASTRTLDFVISDGFTSSNTLSRNITVFPVNDPPDVNTISGTPTPLVYTEGDGDVPIDDQITVDDPDDDNFEGATVSIASFQASEDIIAFTDQNGITGSIAGGILTLSGSSSKDNYRDALRSVTFENTSQNPNTTTRTVSFTVTDGDANSVAFTRDINIIRVNDAPLITTTATTSATEDILYTYTAGVTDPDDANDGTQLTWSLTNEPAGMVVSSTGEVTWTPTEGVLTSGSVTLTVADGGENGAAADTEIFTITVTPVNDGPIINTTAPTTATEDVLYTYTAGVTDPDDANDGVELTWTLTNEPAGMVVSSTGEVTWTPTEGVLTSGAVTLTVADGGEDGAVADDEIFTITVTPVNDGPIINTTAPTTATEDILYTYTAGVTDPDDANDGTQLTWSLTNEPAGMVVSNTGEVTWTPTEGVLTSGAVTLTVADGGENGAAADTEIFTITVTPVNDGPIINTTAPTTATEDVFYTYTAGVTDPDDANDGVELTWTLTNEPAGMVVSSTGEVTWTPTEGVLTSGAVTLTVADGGENGAAADTEIFTISVTPVNDGPIINTTAPTTATEDVLYTYTAGVTDPDDANDGVELTWTLTNEPAGMVVSSTGEVTWTPTEGVLTSGAVTLTVADGGEDGASSDSEVFTITVTPVNDGPIINTTAPTTATEDVLYTYTAGVTDPDDANDGVELTWTLTNEPAGMVVSAIGEVTWTPTEGILTSGAVTLTVADGGEDGAVTDDEIFTITVTPVNDGPIINTTAPTTATEDILYTYTAGVTDPDDANDGTQLTWSLTNEPAGMVVSSTGEVTWTPTEGVLTSGSVTLTVADGGEDGASSDSEVFTITVTPVNDGPIINTTAPTTATEDVLYTYTAGVTDPDDANDGVELTWTLTNEPAGMVVSTTGEVTWTPTEGVLTSGAVTLTVADGGENGSAADTEIFTITVTPVNDGPIINTTAPTTATEDVLYTYTAGVTDPDDANDGVELIWSLTNEPAGMVVSSTGVVTWTPANGVLTSGAVTLTVADGGEDGASSDSEVFTITVTPVNDGPIINTTAPTTATEDVLYTYTAGVTDPDDANDGVELTWTLTNEPAGMVVSSTGEVTWTPTEGILTSGAVTLTVADGGEDGAVADDEIFTITVTPVNDGPIINTTAPTTATEDILYTYTAGVTDPDDVNDGTQLTWSLTNEPAGMVVSSTGEVTWTPTEGVLTSGSVTLTVADGGEDGASSDSEVFTITVTPVNDGPVILVDGVPVTSIDIVTNEDTPLAVSLTVSDPEGNAVSVDSGISLDGAGTISLDADPLTFIYNPELNYFGLETLEVTLCDDGTPSECVTLTVNATINPVNDLPVVDSPVNTLDYNEGEGASVINSQITLSDVDDVNFEGGSVSIFSGYQASEDLLAFTDQNGITGSVVANVLTLSGTATLADYQLALQSITYENTSGAPDISPREIEFIINDGDDNSLAFITTITIISIIEAPVLSGSGGVLNYTEGDGQVVIDNAITSTDADDINYESASISISNNYISGEDFLDFTDQSGITGTFDSATGILTLSGASLIVNYEAALSSISYENTSANPSTSLRTVTYTVNDGDINSNTISRDINLIPTNSAPIAIDDTYTTFEDYEDPLTGNVLDNDSDPESDNLTVNTTPVSNVFNGTLTLNADGSFDYTPNPEYFGTDNFTYEVCDDGIPSLCSQAVVTITIDEVIDVIVFQAVSPNSDGLNDTWKIQDIQKFPNNTVRLFDRWNVLVYEASGYDNTTVAWSGESNSGVGRDELPNGTYFYMVDLGDGSTMLKGYLVLKR